MKKIAFYSYKGGVGRTTVLANVAHNLARRGKNIFIIDLDLDAPGIHLFKDLEAPEFEFYTERRDILLDELGKLTVPQELREEIIKKSSLSSSAQLTVTNTGNGFELNGFEREDEENQLTFLIEPRPEAKVISVKQKVSGVVEFFSEWVGKLETQKNTATTLDPDVIRATVPDLPQYVYEVKKRAPFWGTIRIMRAGANVASEYGVLKQKFENNLREVIDRKLLKLLCRTIKDTYKPDYILIDTRSGFEGYSRVALNQMPDFIIIVTNANERLVHCTRVMTREIIKYLSPIGGASLIISKYPTDSFLPPESRGDRREEIWQEVKKLSNEFDLSVHRINFFPELMLGYKILNDNAVAMRQYNKLVDKIEKR